MVKNEEMVLRRSNIAWSCWLKKVSSKIFVVRWGFPYSVVLLVEKSKCQNICSKMGVSLKLGAFVGIFEFCVELWGILFSPINMAGMAKPAGFKG